VALNEGLTGQIPVEARRIAHLWIGSTFVQQSNATKGPQIMRSMNLGLLAVAILTAMAGQTQADQIFNFSFTNNPGFGNVAGTVTGQIDLSFNGDGTGAASQVTIDAAPTGLLSLPFETLTASSTVIDNAFTVSGGRVTSAEFQVNDGINPVNQSSLGIELALNNNFGVNLLYIDPPNTAPEAFVLANNAGLSGANIVATPAPPTIVLLASGTLAAGGFRFCRRRRGTAGSRPAS
jgi:hypothetical protein